MLKVIQTVNTPDNGLVEIETLLKDTPEVEVRITTNAGTADACPTVLAFPESLLTKVFIGLDQVKEASLLRNQPQPDVPSDDETPAPAPIGDLDGGEFPAVPEPT